MPESGPAGQSGHPADGLRRRGGVRQPGRQDARHRSRRSGRSQRLRERPGAPGRTAGAPAPADHSAPRPRLQRGERARAAVPRQLHPRGLRARGGYRQGIHPRRRLHAGGAVAAHVHRLQRRADRPVPRAALLQPDSVHVLLQLRRLPRGGQLAGSAGARRGRPGHRAPDRRHPPARRHR
ncbi:hypothetical protein D3C78_1187880 [compost metagenome]